MAGPSILLINIFESFLLLFSSYGEAVFLAFQTIVIAFLVLYFNGKKAEAVGYVSAYVASMAFLMSPYVPFQLLSALQTSNALVIMVSKVSAGSHPSLSLYGLGSMVVRHPRQK